uniref:Uncharacterized protein n=1 Tax=Arundo donax TaxID=35708 RepID=A0A0A9DNQ5_ARUDO
MYVHQSKLQIQDCKNKDTMTMYDKVNDWLTSCLFCFSDFSDYGHCLQIWELQNGKPNTLGDVGNSEWAVSGSL